MKAAYLFVILSLGLTSANRFTFENDMEGWISFRDQWRWGNRQTEETLFPGENDGFVLMDDYYGSDELFHEGITLPEGGEVAVTFFGRSTLRGANTFYIQKSYTSVDEAVNVLDLSSYLTPTANSWETVHLSLEPDDRQFFLGFFCYNGERASSGEYFQGCAIDSIIFENYMDLLPTTTEQFLNSTIEGPNETTTKVPVTTEGFVDVTTEDVIYTTEDYVETTTKNEVETTTKDKVETTTEFYHGTTTKDFNKTTTEDYIETTTEVYVETTTTNSPKSTTEDYIKTTPDDLTTTKDPIGTPTEEYIETTLPNVETTPEQTTTTAKTTEGFLPTNATTIITTEAFEQSTTTPKTTTILTTETTSVTTTETIPDHYNYDFQSGAQGWTFSHMNGASWKRVNTENVSDISVGSPSAGPWVIQVIPREVYAGTVLAQSPIYISTQSTLAVSIIFWLEGSTEYPAHLKVRRRTSYSEFDEEPIVNLDAYGDQINSEYVEYSGFLYNVTIGEEFTLNIEGCLGANNDNEVVVSEVSIYGVEEKLVPESSLYDFESGLAGWTSGNMDGGKWIVMGWTENGEALGIPKPVSGDQFLFVDRFDIHSGVTTIETPPFRIISGTTKGINMKFWTRGSVVYPAAIRFRLKSEIGEYAELPFLNLEKYGDAEHQAWVSLEEYYEIPLPLDVGLYQIIIEADLGSDKDNLVALDDLQITTIYF